jgi:hypothetical protein
MIRTLLVSCVALLVWEPLFVSPAAACISCEYTPEVANSPHPNARRKARNTAVKERPAKRRAPARQIAGPQGSPKAAASRNVATRDAAPESEAPAAEAYTVSKKPSAAPVERAERVDSRPHVQASTEQPTLTNASAPSTPPEAATAPAALGCKKFVPTAGVTISVACE